MAELSRGQTEQKEQQADRKSDREDLIHAPEKVKSFCKVAT